MENPLRKSALELRCEELGLEELFWETIRLGARVDDLESAMGEVNERYAASQAKFAERRARAAVEDTPA